LEISFDHSVKLLKTLIETPSFSRQEKDTADIIEAFFKDLNIPIRRKHNNIWVRNKHFTPDKPTSLLNSHHDTVRPGPDWIRDPFTPSLEDEKIYGLGSNDAGAALVSLLAAFLEYYDRPDLKYNLIFLASAEEEISGPEGIESVLNDIGSIEFGIVGEPTGMQMAIAEKGLMVLDCLAEGISGHAAKDVGKNAIYIAMDDIAWIKKYRFSLNSKFLGPVKMTTTMVKAGSHHNVIPDRCEFVIDVRSTDMYTNEEILDIIKGNLKSKVKARSTRLQPSHIALDHVLIKTAEKLRIITYGSDTLSDQALMPFPTIKIGPGDSSRSHTADEFVLINELKEGNEGYVKILDEINK
jgi:acetylornithine deacetylase